MSNNGWYALGALGWLILICYMFRNPLFYKNKPLPHGEAYRIALTCGFSGSHKEWLDSLGRATPPPVREWYTYFKEYFHDSKDGLVYYPGTYQPKEVLRLPLKNPYQPHSDEWYEQEYVWCYTEDDYHEDHLKPTFSYMEWHKWHMLQTAVSRKKETRAEQIKKIRPRVEAKIRVQHRRPARSNY